MTNKVDHTASNNIIAAALARGDIEYLPFIVRFENAEIFNQTAKDLSPGMVGQFEANGVMYSVVHNPALQIAEKDPTKDKTIAEFYTVYAQNAAIEDPDECLIDTESFDTVFQCVTWIRNRIEAAIINEFLPEVITE